MPPITADEVGAYFVTTYYKALFSTPNLAHQFYSDNSTMIRVDGNTAETAFGAAQIQAILMSLNFLKIEFSAIHSLESWGRGVLVMPSGVVTIKDAQMKRKFVQCVFLAPQENGYFVLNEIFKFFDDGVTTTDPSSESGAPDKVDTQPPTSTSTTSLSEPPAVNIEEQQQLPQQDLETGTVGQETSAEEASSTAASVDTNHERHVAYVEQLLEEPPPQRTYASVLLAPRPPRVAQRAVQRPRSTYPIDPVTGFERVPTPPCLREGSRAHNWKNYRQFRGYDRRKR